MSRVPSDLSGLRDVLVYLEGIGYGELYLPEGGGAGPAAGAPAPAPTPEPGRTAPPAPRAAAVEAPPSAEERAAALAAVAREAETCERCKLCRGRTTVVFGTGDADADLMFIGEGPGAEEDRQGLPFVGPAGQLLDKIIQAIGLERPQVYIANIVKCRPPGNRDPQPDEAAACRPFLERQIELVRPKVIVALGRVAAQALLGNDLPLGRMRGRWFTVQGVPTMVTYHPAALLRNRHWKRPTWEDMQAVRDRLHAE
jgi:DNA polymerase